MRVRGICKGYERGEVPPDQAVTRSVAAADGKAGRISACRGGPTKQNAAVVASLRSRFKAVLPFLKTWVSLQMRV